MNALPDACNDRTGFSRIILLLAFLLPVHVGMAGAGGNAASMVTQNARQVADGIVSDGSVIEVITPEQAEKYRANYTTYINGLPDRSTNLFYTNMNLKLLDAIRKQSRTMNAEPGQEGVRIVYGLKDLSASRENRQFVEMIYPLNSNNQVMPFTSGKVYVVLLPTLTELSNAGDGAASGELSNMRGVLNCPPYCD